MTAGPGWRSISTPSFRRAAPLSAAARRRRARTGCGRNSPGNRQAEERGQDGQDDEDDRLRESAGRRAGSNQTLEQQRDVVEHKIRPSPTEDVHRGHGPDERVDRGRQDGMDQASRSTPPRAGSGKYSSEQAPLLAGRARRRRSRRRQGKAEEKGTRAQRRREARPTPAFARFRRRLTSSRRKTSAMSPRLTQRPSTSTSSPSRSSGCPPPDRTKHKRSRFSVDAIEPFQTQQSSRRAEGSRFPGAAPEAAPLTP